MDAAAAEVEALRCIRAVIAREPVPPVAGADAMAVGVAIGETFARMREAAREATSAWALGFIEGELARLLLALGGVVTVPEDPPA
jgi:hydrogenase/urease accessory protein HupE